MTPEQTEQLKQIKLARQCGVLPWSHLSSSTQIKNCAENTVDFLLSLVKSQEADGGANNRRANAMAARADWKRWDWDGAKPYKEHLRERLKTADDYLGYLDACYDEGPETFALAVQDVLDFISTSTRSACVEKLRERAGMYKALADASLPNDQTAARTAAAAAALSSAADELSIEPKEKEES